MNFKDKICGQEEHCRNAAAAFSHYIKSGLDILRLIDNISLNTKWTLLKTSNCFIQFNCVLKYFFSLITLRISLTSLFDGISRFTCYSMPKPLCCKKMFASSNPWLMA